MIWNPPFETMPMAERRELQLERLQNTCQWVYERVPFYRRAFDEQRVEPDQIRSLDDLRRLPFTRKSDLRDHYPFGMFAVPKNQVARIQASSGTRGKPTVVGYTRRDLETWAEVMARTLACAGAKPGDVVHNAYGYGLFTGGLGFHYGAERLGATVVPASGGGTQRQITLMQDFKANVLCCTPSYALNIADVMEDMGIRTQDLALERGVFGAEPWTEGMRAQIEARLSIAAIDIYGLAEVIGPGVSVECHEEKNGLHIFEDYFLVELVDPSTGEPVPLGSQGELVFTTLLKEAFLVVRYRTGDLAVLSDEPCRCGRTYVRMSKLKGRTDDMLIIRGINVFPSEVEATLVGMPELSPHYQIIVDRPRALDVMEVQVEVAETFLPRTGGQFDPAHPETQVLTARVSKRLESALGVGCGVTLKPPKTVPRSEGKAVRVVDKRPRA